VQLQQPRSRIFGLDLLRTCAIGCVVLVHSSFILAPSFPGFPWIPLPDGVDLFFVLSGFLIGGMLITRLEATGGLDASGLFDFIQRRWFRTLPNYFLFLGLNCVLVYLKWIPGSLNKYLLTFFVFFQNFYIPFDFLFWESWSLSVEEWFYLSFPLFCFLLFRIRKWKVSKMLLLLILGYLVLPLVYRIYSAAPGSTVEHWDLFVRKLVLTRLDSIGFGLLAAYLYYYRNAFWNKVRYVFFAIGLSGTILLCLIRIPPVTFFFTDLLPKPFGTLHCHVTAPVKQYSR